MLISSHEVAQCLLGWNLKSIKHYRRKQLQIQCQEKSDRGCGSKQCNEEKFLYLHV